MGTASGQSLSATGTGGALRAGGKIGGLGAGLRAVGRRVGRVVGQLADSRAAGWASDRVREIVVPDKIIRGYQDIYKGFKTSGPVTTTIRTVKVVTSGDPPRVSHTKGRISQKKGATAGPKVTSSGPKVSPSGPKVTSSGRQGIRISVKKAQLRIPNGYREVTRLDLQQVKRVGSTAHPARSIAKSRREVFTQTRTKISTSPKGFKKPFGMDAVRVGLRNIFEGALKAAKTSALINLGLAVGFNGYWVLTGQKGMPEAIGTVVAETAGGFVAGGFAAVVSGGVVAAAGALGLTAGFPIFVVGLAASIGAYVICNAIFQAAIGDRIKGLVERIFGG